MKHVLVTNDYPPKIGGIQNYLWELWRRLPSDFGGVYTSKYRGAESFDKGESYAIFRSPKRWLYPTQNELNRIERFADRMRAEMIIWDPALPIGRLALRSRFPYGVIVHGAELTVPARLPWARSYLRPVLSNAKLIIAAGEYVADEVRRLLKSASGPRIVVVPPGVDVDRFVPLSTSRKKEIRETFGLDEHTVVINSVSRLVTRKGMDTLIRAIGLLAPQYPQLRCMIGGVGRDRKRLEKIIAKSAPEVKLVGRVSDEDLPDFIAMGDVFAMICRNRWGGLEQEGFGIVFAEASSCALPCIAGNSGGAKEAVLDKESGLVIGNPRDLQSVMAALKVLIDDQQLRQQFGHKGRDFAVGKLNYSTLSERLSEELQLTQELL